MSVLINKGTYLWIFSWIAEKRVNLYTRLSESSQFTLGQRPKPSSANYTTQIISATPYSPKAASLNWLQLWKWWVKYTFQGQGRGKEPPIVRALLLSQLAVTASHWPPPIVLKIEKESKFHPCTLIRLGFSEKMEIPVCYFSHSLMWAFVPFWNHSSSLRSIPIFLERVLIFGTLLLMHSPNPSRLSSEQFFFFTAFSLIPGFLLLFT